MATDLAIFMVGYLVQQDFGTRKWNPVFGIMLHRHCSNNAEYRETEKSQSLNYIFFSNEWYLCGFHVWWFLGFLFITNPFFSYKLENVWHTYWYIVLRKLFFYIFIQRFSRLNFECFLWLLVVSDFLLWHG